MKITELDPIPDLNRGDTEVKQAKPIVFLCSSLFKNEEKKAFPEVLATERFDQSSSFDRLKRSIVHVLRMTGMVMVID